MGPIERYAQIIMHLHSPMTMEDQNYSDLTAFENKIKMLHRACWAEVLARSRNNPSTPFLDFVIQFEQEVQHFENKIIEIHSVKHRVILIEYMEGWKDSIRIAKKGKVSSSGNYKPTNRKNLSPIKFLGNPDKLERAYTNWIENQIIDRDTELDDFIAFFSQGVPEKKINFTLEDNVLLRKLILTLKDDNELFSISSPQYVRLCNTCVLNGQEMKSGTLESATETSKKPSMATHLNVFK